MSHVRFAEFSLVRRAVSIERTPRRCAESGKHAAAPAATMPDVAERHYARFPSDFISSTPISLQRSRPAQPAFFIPRLHAVKAVIAIPLPLQWMVSRRADMLVHALTPRALFSFSFTLPVFRFARHHRRKIFRRDFTIRGVAAQRTVCSLCLFCLPRHLFQIDTGLQFAATEASFRSSHKMPPIHCALKIVAHTSVHPPGFSSFRDVRQNSVTLTRHQRASGSPLIPSPRCRVARPDVLLPDFPLFAARRAAFHCQHVNIIRAICVDFRRALQFVLTCQHRCCCRTARYAACHEAGCCFTRGFSV